ncbi:glycoside hydrolase family 3 N-terminal domain-containing protein [Alkalicoccobacillus gibsonii]|uniref:glycoside hydrolase family 3 N-terminal domain-containing protein n=1 Tax=Alkalicoccobacillus gibsonii TaxID=79881 RepID=UPI0019348B3F|nr:glycoside hydrolase family 3 N-terminal domain-containing protein [Alkalicoccobacillus gibsonii]MBM0066934.1 glycoside hydrolase family 3 C-terminal domain-containing protein [Alkalicoccobacillus gibsonii]
MKYKDGRLPISERVENLLEQMTLEEKVGQLNQKMYGWDAYRKTENGIELTEAFKEHVAQGKGMGALYGLFRSDPWSAVTYENGIPTEDNVKVSNMIQQYVKEHTRLGIPVLLSEECPHGHQALDGTVIPTNIGVGATWNPELMEKAYKHVALEIQSRGAHVGLISTLDLLRDPRWGRSEECYSEDPYLASKMTSAAVTGLQGRPDEEDYPRVAAVLKHFAAQGAGEGGLNAGTVAIGERELREIHLPGMKAGVEAGALGCMAAYNEIDGVPCHANARLLTEILRAEWGFKGIVMADGTAVDRLNMMTGSYEKSGALALQSGVDLSLWDVSFTQLAGAVKKGFVEEQYVDEAVRRVLTLKFSLGLMDQTFSETNNKKVVVGSDEFKKVNLQVARESIVLLKNQDLILPLNKKTKKIAVVGPNADQIYHQLGDYTAIQAPNKGKTILEGIIDQSEGNVSFAKGCSVRGTSEEDFEEAIQLAREADVVVAVIGGSSARNFDINFDINGAAIVSGNPSDMDCGEGVDVADLSLGGVQEKFIYELSQTGTPVIAVLIQGRPHAISSILEHCQAIICGWYPGQEGGTAIGEVIFGDVNPSGKLPVSIPRSSAQLPVYYNSKEQSSQLRYLDMEREPLFSFGYGLSYTTFDYQQAYLPEEKITVKELNNGKRVFIHVDIINSGTVEGSEVVQLYIKDVEASVTQRIKTLRGFQKCKLSPGEKKTVSLDIGKEDLSLWNQQMKEVVEPGVFHLMLGGSVESIIQLELTVVE